MTRCFSVFLLALCFFFAAPAAAQAQAREPSQQARIEHLIASIGQLREAVFIRNGKEYDAPRAAEHLRKKLDYAADRIATAEQFIDECATASWFSRRKYTIRFKDGRVVESAPYLRARLEQFDSARAR